MKISVIIVTYNRINDLRESLTGFYKQTYPDKEIILIDNASCDGTGEMVKSEFPDVIYFRMADNFDIRSLNLAIQMSSGEIIWRTDDDSYPESPDAFEKVIEIFNNQNVDVIATEDIEVHKNFSVWEWYPFNIDKVNIPPDGYKAHIFPGTGAAIRKKVFDTIGGFWEFGYEEVDFCTRAILAGFNVRYFPNIHTLHFARHEQSDRNYPNRWLRHSKQMLRYNWKNFPFFMALWRTINIYFFQFIVAIVKKVPPSAILEGFFTFTAVIFSTCRNERKVVPRNRIYDLTLGQGIFLNQMKFFTYVMKTKINKLFGKIKKKLFIK